MKFAFFKGGGTLLDKGIRWWERGPYSHVEAILGEVEEGRYQIASSVPGTGVRITISALPSDQWDIIEGPGDEQLAKSWFLKHNGAPYDYLGLLGFVLRPVVTEDKSKFWCSEAVGAAIGLDEPWRFDPNTLADVIRFSQSSLVLV